MIRRVFSARLRARATGALSSTLAPARAATAAFATAVALGTLALYSPLAHHHPVHGSPLVTAIFTATSAVCVTGLVIEDTATYWTSFGHVVILGLIAVGGFGLTTLAALLHVLAFRKIGLTNRLFAAAETRAMSLGEVGDLLRRIAGFVVCVQAVAALVLALRFAWGYAMPWPRAIWYGFFHAISGFNNAGFALYSDSMMSFTDDPVVLGVLCAALIAGGMGYPVASELMAYRQHRTPVSLHTRATCGASLVLLIAGTLLIAVFEWTHTDTLGALPQPDRIVNAFFASANARTAGFNSIDYSAIGDDTMLITIMLMFIGGGSAGTAGGIKVTTAVIMVLAVLAEIRGDKDIVVAGRRVGAGATRQAFAVTSLALAVVCCSTLLLTATSDERMATVMFEVTSAFATVGLSDGVTARLEPWQQLFLATLMFAGRIGPVAVAAAFAVPSRRRWVNYPEENPLIG